MNNESESICKEAVVVYFNVGLLFDICLEAPRKSTKILSQDSRSSARDLNPRPPEYEAGSAILSDEKFGDWSCGNN
jgi:hypothetical protein